MKVDDDDDNLVMDMEEMMSKENIGHGQMIVPGKNKVQKCMEKNAKAKRNDKDSNEKKNESQSNSIFEKDETDKIDKAKKQ